MDELKTLIIKGKFNVADIENTYNFDVNFKH